MVNLMSERFSRLEMMIGKDSVKILRESTVAVFGLGGVGGACVEALARGGVGHLVLIDSDRVNLSNFNRQIIATEKTLGLFKTEASLMRIKEINPDAKVTLRECFFLPENSREFDFSEFDYVVDAIDTVSGKKEICRLACEAGVPVISAMGAGNKLDPTLFKVSDIFETKVCPLARVMRREMKKLGIEKLKCVYSEEEPCSLKFENTDDEPDKIKKTPGSLSFVPPVMGYILAGEVIKDLIKKE